MHCVACDMNKPRLDDSLRSLGVRTVVHSAGSIRLAWRIESRYFGQGNMRWIIGDIHGMLGPLETLLEAVGRADREPLFLFVGDYVNRGPDSKRVIELLLALPGARFCRGNHDDVFDLVLNGRCYADNATESNRMSALRWFLQHGLDRTFISYGADAADVEYLIAQASPDRVAALVELVPAKHRQFVRSLPGLIEFPDIFIAHAKWSVHAPTELPSLAVELAAKPILRHNIIWGRYTASEILSDKPWERTGFFGHTPITHYIDARHSDDLMPVKGPNIVLVDTAAALSAGGRLTAYCAETGQSLQADHFGKFVEPRKRKKIVDGA